MSESLPDAEHPERNPLPRNVYIHFLDIYHSLRAIQGNRAPKRLVWHEGRLAFRLAFLCAETLMLPASSYFESELAQWVLNEHQLLSDMGFISLTAGDDSLESQRDSKLKQYGPQSPHHLRHVYQLEPDCTPPPYVQRKGSSLARIKRYWEHYISSGALHNRLSRIAPWIDRQLMDKLWMEVPSELGGRAFTPDHVKTIINQMGVQKFPSLILAQSIEGPYVRGYPTDIGAHLVCDLNYLASPFPLGARLSGISYRNICVGLATVGLLDLIDDCNVSALLALKLVPQLRSLCEYFNRSFELSQHVWDIADAARRAISTLIINNKSFDTRSFLMPRETGSSIQLPMEGKLSKDGHARTNIDHKSPKDILAGGLFGLMMAFLIAALAIFGISSMLLGVLFMAAAALIGALLIWTEVIPSKSKTYKFALAVLIFILFAFAAYGIMRFKSHEAGSIGAEPAPSEKPKQNLTTTHEVNGGPPSKGNTAKP